MKPNSKHLTETNPDNTHHVTSIGLGRPVSAVWLAPLLLATALAGGCGDSSTSATTSSGAGSSTSTGSGGGGTGGQGGTGQGGSAGSSGCLPASVQDDFAGVALDTALWKVDTATGMTIDVVDQHLTFTPAASFDNTRHAIVRTANTFDLTCTVQPCEVP